MITQTFLYSNPEFHLEAKDFRKAMHFIRGFYRDFLQIEVGNIQYIIRTHIPVQSTQGKCFSTIAVFTPLDKETGKPLQNTSSKSSNFLEKLDLDAWDDYTYLGSLHTDKGSLLPLAVLKSSISNSSFHVSDEGLCFLKPSEPLDSYDDVINVCESLYSQNVVSYQTNLEYDMLLALEYLQSAGGQALTEPRFQKSQLACGASSETYQIFCALPSKCTLQTLKDAIRNIKLGKLPYHSFTGFWSIVPNDYSWEEINKRRLSIHAVALFAYAQLAELFSYLSPSIYDVSVGKCFEVICPIATQYQHLLFQRMLEDWMEKYPLDAWFVLPYTDNGDLIVKRFAYEKRSPLVIAPPLEKSSFTFASVKEAQKFLVVFEPENVLSDLELLDEKEYVIDLLREMPQLSSPDGLEQRCYPHCGLERSVCCVNTLLNERVEPSDLKDIDLEKLTFEEEENLRKMEYGLRGYFQLGGVLKGLFENAPLLPSLRHKETKMQEVRDATLVNKLLMYTVETSKGSFKRLEVLDDEQVKRLEGSINHKNKTLVLKENSLLEQLENEANLALKEKWDEGLQTSVWAHARMNEGYSSYTY